MAFCVLSSSSVVGLAGGEMSRDDPAPSEEASAKSLAESLYMLTGDFYAIFAFAIIFCTIDYFFDYVRGAGCSKLTPAFTADRFVADKRSLASSNEDIVDDYEPVCVAGS